MPYAFWEAVAQTPWWIYWIFVGLCYFAYLTTKPRIVFVRSALISESIFIGLLVVCLIYLVPFTLFHALFFFSFACLGTLIGWLQFRYGGIKAIKNKLQWYVPGSWMFFFFIFLVIFIKYYFFGPRFLVDTLLLQQSDLHFFMLCIIGLYTGLFMGRAYYGIRCIKKGPYIEEKDLPRK